MMKMKNISYCLFAGLLLGACSGGVYEKTENGVIVKVQQKGDTGARLVRLQVMGEKLIHVSATPDKKFADPQSLIIVPRAEQTPFTVAQQGDTVTVSTDEVRASVLASTGEVWFTDEDGNLILQENKGGGKTFTPIEVEGTRGYTVRQVFESPDDEAFYGLGQHQADYCWIAIHYAVSETRTIIPSWAKCSSSTIRTGKKVPLPVRMCLPKGRVSKRWCAAKTRSISSIW